MSLLFLQIDQGLLMLKEVTVYPNPSLILGRPFDPIVIYEFLTVVTGDLLNITNCLSGCLTCSQSSDSPSVR
jgi:hypothetical protein